MTLEGVARRWEDLITHDPNGTIHRLLEELRADPQFGLPGAVEALAKKLEEASDFHPDRFVIARALRELPGMGP